MRWYYKPKDLKFITKMHYEVILNRLPDYNHLFQQLELSFLGLQASLQRDIQSETLLV